MSNKEEVFSLRLVIAEFYMEKPIPGLDACYSEFRGKEIKKVPVIRIFGSNAQGQKTCMHVHGVFPYFYIPYDKKDFESINQAIYQIAINIDKAINISLSQGGSSAQHVFKVQLVKGIPFYGYHRSEHQFLKIYMFNPRFVRRAANLLQNGAILNKNFHPHESHVPYILQFMIDYNLYGMSFIHVPLEIVKFRLSEPSEVIPFKNLQDTQILNINLVKKTSCSALEVDVGSNFILNRFQLIAKSNTTHTNPGIESIWNDERLRRQKLANSVEDEEKLDMIPPLEIPPTQERPEVQPTESEIFYRTGLLSKLLAMETSMLESTQISNQTLSSSNISNITLNLNNIISTKQQKKTFSLSKILQNVVYPEECTPNDNLADASFIPNHLSNSSLLEQNILESFNQTKTQIEKNVADESIFMEDTIVDEELVLSLTQQHQNVPLDATLRKEDMELLDILQQLEENNEEKIDLDSSLAPLSQNHINFILSPQELDKETTAAALQQPFVDTDSENDAENDDNLHDFSIVLENLEDLILKLSQSQKEKISENSESGLEVPQVDGSDDLLKTPTKTRKIVKEKLSPNTPRNKHLNMGSPHRSPRAPKTGHKYAQLPLVSIDRSASKTIADISNETTPHKESSDDRNSLSMFSLRKKLALSDLRRKSITVDTNAEIIETASKEIPRLKFVTCSFQENFFYGHRTMVHRTKKKLIYSQCHLRAEWQLFSKAVTLPSSMLKRDLLISLFLKLF